MLNLEKEVAAFRNLRDSTGWTAGLAAMSERLRTAESLDRQKLFVALADMFREEFPRKGADTDLERRQLARQFAEQIASGGMDHSAGVGRLLITLARIAGDHDEVVRLGQELVRQHPGQKHHADKAIGTALFNLKRYEEAHGYLAALPEEAQSDATRTLLGRMSAGSVVDVARDRLRRTFDQADLGSSDSALDEVHQVIATLHPGIDARLDLSTAVLLGRRPALVEPSHIDVVDRLVLVFCGGFRWSGASAVYDYLSEQPEVEGFWRKPRFMQDGPTTFEHVLGAFGGSPEQVMAALRGFFVEQVLGVVWADGRKNAALGVLEGSLLRQMTAGVDLAVFDQRLAWFFSQVLDRAHLPQDARAFPGGGFASALRALAALCVSRDKKYVLFDSVIRAPQVAMLRHIPDARMVAVTRDPRDMYITHVERGRWKKGVGRYIRELKGFLDDFEQAMAMAEVAKVCLPVRFEDFVRDEETREAVLRWLGMEPAKPTEGAVHFSPEQSATNISLYRAFGDEKALRALEEAFPRGCRGTTLDRRNVKVLSLSAMATKRKQQDLDGKAGKPGEPGWMRRREIVVNILADGAYDFFGLQHCYASPSHRFDAVGYFGKALADRGLEYGVINRVVGDDPREGDSTPLYFRRDRWELDDEEHGDVWFKTPAPSKEALGGGGLLFVFGLFHERGLDGSRTGRALYVYNVRLRNKLTDELDIYRARCFLEIAGSIAARKKQDVPVVLMGDTNDKLVDSITDRLMRGQPVELDGAMLKLPVELQDTLLVLHPEMHGKVRTQHDFKRPGKLKGSDRNSRIFCTTGLDVIQAQILTTNENGMFPSYHYPVVATIGYSDSSPSVR